MHGNKFRGLSDFTCMRSHACVFCVRNRQQPFMERFKGWTAHAAHTTAVTISFPHHTSKRKTLLDFTSIHLPPSMGHWIEGRVIPPTESSMAVYQIYLCAACCRAVMWDNVFRRHTNTLFPKLKKGQIYRLLAVQTTSHASLCRSHELTSNPSPHQQRAVNEDVSQEEFDW